jgi:hypothetical protein
MDTPTPTPTLSRVPAAVVDGHVLSVADVLRHAHTASGLELVDRAIDNHIIWREVERRGVRVLDEELEQTVARTYGERASVPSEHVRREIHKTIAFGKLKGEVTDELLGPHGRPWLAGLDLAARRVIRDALFLYWLRQARQAAAITTTLAGLLDPPTEPEAP